MFAKAWLRGPPWLRRRWRLPSPTASTPCTRGRGPLRSINSSPRSGAPIRRPGRCRSCGTWPPWPWSGLRCGRPAGASQLICALAAAYFAWIGIGYFAWLSPGIGLSGVWAGVFTLQAVLLVVAGVVRRDLVIRPRRDLSSGLGAVFIT